MTVFISHSNYCIDFSGDVGEVFYTKLPSANMGFVFAQTLSHTSKPIFVITDTTQNAIELQEAYQFFHPDAPCLIFPSLETLAYDQFSPHQSIISERLLTLKKLLTLKQGLIIAPLNTILQRLPPVSYLAGQIFLLKVGEHFDREAMRKQLEYAGYHSVSQVSLPGEYAARGSLLDIYPMGAAQPFRIDLFDDEIESIKQFDPETQRSADSLPLIEILPAHEFPLNAEGIRLFREQFRETFACNPTQCSMYEAVSRGEAPAGIEYFLSLFFTETASIFDYLPKDCLMTYSANLQALAQHEWQRIRERYDQLSHDIMRPLLPPEKVFITLETLQATLKHYSRCLWVDPAEATTVQRKYLREFPFTSLPDLKLESQAENPLSKLKTFSQNKTLLFCAESTGRRENLIALLKPSFPNLKLVENWQGFLNHYTPSPIQDEVYITIAQLEEGFVLNESHISIVPEAALLGAQAVQSRRKKTKHFDTELIIRHLAELTINDPIVHIDHGIGRYQGLEILSIGQMQGEFLKIAYEGGNVYVPVSNLHLISRYNGVDSDHAPMHRLGSDQWEKAKRKAAEQVRDVAAELLKIYAARAAREGMRCHEPDEHYQTFAASFPFEETIDQEKAIQAVIEDMCASQPMDRLICGDVGFGKTEVAMRAAFLAVHSGKQVAVLVPTTLLAQQHYETFSDRFAAWPVKVDVLSRFRSAKEQVEVLERLANGQVDILIGTHKILQSTIKFHDLGLLIIDEEHRFGVRQKEALKAWRTNIDVLTMTATPIPRTLNMAMSAMRDMSIIATPPAKRLSIKTFVREYEPSLVREAIMRETLRGGQVYYLHNDVATIEKAAEELRQLVPEARVIVAHGQMHERELEHVMSDFYHQRFNVLVCSTIIETGIDVPNANTMIIQRADKFGLAQLHQLRGRVGRSHHQAYAYLLIPSFKALSGDAQKRLEAIEALEDLGAGFVLATHDLEIRGAGELLGENQSGQIQAIGYTLYTEMLDRAVKAMQQGELVEDLEQLREQDNCEIELQVPAFIPDQFIADVNIRLIFYKRIASCQDTDSLNELRAEMIDRFGILPAQTEYLFQQMTLKQVALSKGIQKIEASAKGGRIEFSVHAKVDVGKIIKLIQLHPQAFKLDGPNKLKFTWLEEIPVEQRIDKVKEILAKT
jgi:transcription-repair coupling factor (superfamily II helicase)